MKTHLIIKLKKGFTLASVLFVLGCQNDDKDLKEAKFSKDPNVFIDTFSAGLDYGAFGSTDIFAFQVDNKVTYNNSTAAMRIDVPNEDTGLYAGGAYLTGVGRDLTSYNALTFWAKSSVAATVGVLGFGVDFDKNKYTTSLVNTHLSTAWRKYIIPIPDASKLKSQKGLFYFSAGAHENGGNGFSFWLDEVKFENLGTLAHIQPVINSGLNTTESLYLNTTTKIANLSATFSLSDGTNPVVNTSPYFFTFSSSNEAEATVDSEGVITQVGSGSAVITATINGVAAKGSITTQSSGTFIHAPEPDKSAGNVISLFSDKYANVKVDFFNGYWGGSSTQTKLITVGGDNLQNYTNLNWVGIQCNNPSVNATDMTMLHLDIFATNLANQSFVIKIRDTGANGLIESDGNGNPTNDDNEISKTVYANQINSAAGSWIPIDIPLTGNIANQKSNVGLIVFVGNISFLLDNLYFYKN